MQVALGAVDPADPHHHRSEIVSWPVSAQVVATCIAILTTILGFAPAAASTVSNRSSAMETISITVSVDPQTRSVGALRATMSFDAADVTSASCDTIAEYASCNVASPGLIVFEAVHPTTWSAPAELVVVEFATVDSRPVVTVAAERSLNADGVDASFGLLIVDGPVTRLGDVNCDGRLDLVDGYRLALHVIGSESVVGSCPLSQTNAVDLAGADTNGDARLSLTDARLIAQCAVGTPTTLCPIA